MAHLLHPLHSWTDKCNSIIAIYRTVYIVLCQIAVDGMEEIPWCTRRLINYTVIGDTASNEKPQLITRDHL